MNTLHRIFKVMAISALLVSGLAACSADDPMATTTALVMPAKVTTTAMVLQMPQIIALPSAMLIRPIAMATE